MSKRLNLSISTLFHLDLDPNDLAGSVQNIF